MKEGEEWKNPDTQGGDYDSPISVSLSSSCKFTCFGHAGQSCLPTSSLVGLPGVRVTD